MRSKNDGFNLLGVGMGLAVFIVAAAAGLYVSKNNDGNGKVEAPTIHEKAQDEKTDFSFDIPKKGAHFETSTPAHAGILAAVPADVVINFNFDLADNSTIRIEKDGKDYAVGNLTFDDNKLTMRRQMDKTAPDGIYTVRYDGCWPDRTCHDGYFQFAINSNLLNTYDDRRNQKTVTVNMTDIRFKPTNLRISPGTTVIWVNDDNVAHYVNTDSHPAHSHVPQLNSKVVSAGQRYSFTFNDSGAYPYHCSAHASDMTGNVVVQ